MWAFTSVRRARVVASRLMLVVALSVVRATTSHWSSGGDETEVSSVGGGAHTHTSGDRVSCPVNRSLFPPMSCPSGYECRPAPDPNRFHCGEVRATWCIHAAFTFAQLDVDCCVFTVVIDRARSLALLLLASAFTVHGEDWARVHMLTCLAVHWLHRCN